MFRRFHNEKGSAITVAAVSAGVLSILVAGFLTYMGNEYLLNYRSHRWTQALHAAEAAVEVGFAEMNYQYFKGTNGFSSARGWSGDPSLYTKYDGNLLDSNGQQTGQMWTYVYSVGTYYPYIYGYAYVLNTPRGAGVWRLVKATLTPSTRHPVALMSRRRIDLNGNSAYTDSFDSSDPAKSTGGLYDSAKRQANGDIASNDVVINSIAIGNADIYGEVSTGVAGTVNMGNNGSVGPTFVSGDRATTVEDGESKGWIRHDFSVDVPDVVLPSAGWANYPTGQLNNSSPTINGGDWRVTSIDLSSTKTLVIQGTVRLYVTGDISVTGNAMIQIDPGAKLEIYAAGSVNVSGNGVVNNTGKAENNQFFGLPSSTSWTIGGNGQWVGTVYAPQADFVMNGGGNSGDMSGAVVADRITLNGTVRFHYDEALRGQNFGTGYRIVSWQSYKWTGSYWVQEQ